MWIGTYLPDFRRSLIRPRRFRCRRCHRYRGRLYHHPPKPASDSTGTPRSQYGRSLGSKEKFIHHNVVRRGHI